VGAEVDAMRRTIEKGTPADTPTRTPTDISGNSGPQTEVTEDQALINIADILGGHPTER
jgi:hypothetical protein